jgi:hypothetical protein
MGRSRAFLLTVWTDKHVQNIKALTTEYTIIAKEQCPKTDRTHYHAFVYFRNARSFTAVRSDIVNNSETGIDCKEVHSGHQNVINYVKKDNDIIYENGDAPRQGNRSDIQALFDDAKNGMTDADLWDNHSTSMLRYSGASRPTNNKPDGTDDSKQALSTSRPMYFGERLESARPAPLTLSPATPTLSNLLRVPINGCGGTGTNSNPFYFSTSSTAGSASLVFYVYSTDTPTEAKSRVPSPILNMTPLSSPVTSPRTPGTPILSDDAETLSYGDSEPEESTRSPGLWTGPLTPPPPTLRRETTLDYLWENQSD